MALKKAAFVGEAELRRGDYLAQGSLLAHDNSANQPGADKSHKWQLVCLTATEITL